MHLLLLGLILFLGVHSIAIVAPSWRDRMAVRFGPDLWRVLYSLVAAAGMVLIVLGYGHARTEPTVLYVSPLWVYAITATLMLPVFPLLLSAYLPGAIRTAARHPMLAAVKIWAFAHLLANGMLADVVLFGSVLAWAVVERISLKRRTPRPVPSAPAGPWNDAIAVVGGLVLYGLMVSWGHAWLIGVPLSLR